MKSKIARIFVAGIIFAVISVIVHNLGSLIDMPVYQNPAYFNLWSKLMMSNAGPPPISFMIWSFVSNLIFGLIFAYIFSLVNRVLSGGTLARGLKFGLIYFLISGVGSFLSMLLIINIPLSLNISWLIQGLIIALSGGVMTAAVIKK